MSTFVFLILNVERSINLVLKICLLSVDYTNKGQFSAVYGTDGRLIEVWARWHMNEVTIAITYEGKITDIC